VLTAFRASGLELCHLQGAWSRPQHFRPGRFLYLPPIVCIQLVALCLRLGRRDRYFLRETASFAALFSDFLLIEARKAR
jgi:hypothetical protein